MKLESESLGISPVLESPSLNITNEKTILEFSKLSKL